MQMARRDERYWEERNNEKLKSVSDVVDSDVATITILIEQGNKELSNQIREMYIKYSKDNEMSYADTLKYLTNDERTEFQKDLKYYIEKYRDQEYVNAHRQELQSLSVRARVKRIEELQTSITKITGELHNHLNGTSKAKLSEIFEESYLHTTHATLGTNISKNFTTPNVRDMEEVLKHPWSGKNYSEKIWDITNSFASRLKAELTRGLIQGKHPDEIARSWRKLNMGKDGTGGTVYECRRLMETEAANLSEQATKKSYEETGVECYRYLTSGHSNVCDDCTDLQKRSNEKAFLVKEAITGINYAPMHPFCRCTSIPATRYDDEDESQYDLPYDEWYAKYVQPEVDAIHRKRLKAGDGNGRIEVEIDEFTECLRDTKTDTLVDTSFSKMSPKEAASITKEWQFNWGNPPKDSTLYALKVNGVEGAQGLLAIRELASEHTMYVDLVESNPANVGKDGAYKGVGGHLFAEACRQAKNNSYDYIYFDAKTKLVDYYHKTLGAVSISNQRMVIDGEAFNNLIKKYYKEG